MILATKLLFLTDSYRKECDSEVVALPTPTTAVLDQTVFYAQGGGQPFDEGVLVDSAGTEFRVLSAKKNGSEIEHLLDKPGLKIGDRVKAKIDWNRRFRLMQMHTSAHVLANVLWKETGALISGNQLGLEESRMDFSVNDFNRDLLKSFEQKANAILDRHLPVSVSFEKFETAIQRPELFRLKDVFPKNLPELRIVSIGDADVQADGGTHVANTSEVGRIEIARLENKGASNRRIYWKLV